MMRPKDNQIGKVILSKQAFIEMLFPEGTEVVDVVFPRNEVYRAPTFHIVVRNPELRELAENEAIPEIMLVHQRNENGAIIDKRFKP